MGKQYWKPGNMLYPLPVVLVSSADGNGHDNLFTVAWTGTICSNPPMVSISVRPERYSYELIEKTQEFTINLTTEKLAYATDYCGVVSGRDVDKWDKMHLTRMPGKTVKTPYVKESPVSMECHVTEVRRLGSHDMFIAEITAVHADEQYMDEKKRFCFEKCNAQKYS